MRTAELFIKLKGTQTIKSVMTLLSINRTMAIYYIHRLRKEGYVKTQYKQNQRIYNISKTHSFGGSNFYDVLSENSPIKLVPSEDYILHGKPIFEEMLIYAINTKKFRIILASLSLFKKISNWKLLYRLAKYDQLTNQICALYDLSKQLFRVKKMSLRFKKHCLKQHKEHIIPGLNSKDFKEIETRWNVFLPFNKVDLEEYK